VDFFETVKRRRSIRRFKPDAFPDEMVEKAFEAAVLAPNSSNTQTWDFHWVKTEEKKKKLIHACMSQSAARTASHLIVATIGTNKWRRSQKPLIGWVRSITAPKKVILYYEKLLPFIYTVGIFNILAPLRWLFFNITNIFSPIMRGPYTDRDLQEIAIKSSALACENFVLAISAQGGATCMMEGFDEWRVKRLLGLGWNERVVMVIGVGYESERGTWGPQFRLPISEIVHKH
jgi:nitroreductase